MCQGIPLNGIMNGCSSVSKDFTFILLVLSFAKRLYTSNCFSYQIICTSSSVQNNGFTSNGLPKALITSTKQLTGCLNIF